MTGTNELLLNLGWAKKFMTPEPDVLVGWLPINANGFCTVYGLATNYPEIAWCVQKEDFEHNEMLLAHEVAHTQGLDHPTETYIGCPGTIAETGFDLEKGVPVPSTTVDF